MDAYKIGVSIAMKNNVSGVLRVIQRDVLGLKHNVDLTQGSFNRMKVAMAGAMGVIGGSVALKGWWDLAKAGSAITNAQGKMLQLGISYRDVMAETVVAMKTASQISGSTTDGNLDSLRLLRNQLGSLQNANKALPALAKAQFVLTSNGYDPKQLDYFIKALDVQGAFVNKKTGQLDPKLFATALHEAIAAVLTTGGLLNGKSFYQASRLSNPAGQAMGTEAYLKNMTEVIVALGNRGARGLEMAATDFIGGKMGRAQINMLGKLHLISSKNVKYAGGGTYVVDTSKMVGASLLDKGDLIGWLKKYFLGAAVAHGLSALKAGAPFRQTLQGLISFLATNWPQMLRSADQQKQAQGTDQYSIAQKMFNGATNDFSTALTNLWHVLGVPAARQAVSILRPLTDGIRDFTGWIGKHPDYVKAMSVMLLGLGTALTVLGGAAVIAAIGGMVGTGGSLAALGAGITAISGVLLATNWTSLSNDFVRGLWVIEKNLQRFVYDILHPGKFFTGGGPSGKPPGPPPPPPPHHKSHSGWHWGTPAEHRKEVVDAVHAINKIQDEVLTPWRNWANMNFPVTVSNPGHIASAIHTGLGKALSAPQSSTTGFNGRVSPYGTPAIAAP